MSRWTKYIKPYWVYFLLGPLCMIVEVLGEVFIPDLFSRMINDGVLKSSESYVVIMCLLMILTAVLMVLCGVGGG